MTNTTVSYPTNMMPLICDCKNLMDPDWVVQVQPIYYEANACANALAKRGTHQQNLLSVYNGCPSFVYMYYVGNKVHYSYIVHVLFIGPTTTLFRKKILKIGLMTLFTYLKFILL